MAEPASNEEKATFYVLGELDRADRQAFEVQIAESTELRALVRELEEGLIGMAAAAPLKKAPRSVWKKIEKAVAEEDQQQKIVSFFSVIWRNGWAAAAACLIGWILYALSVERPVEKVAEKNRITLVEPVRPKEDAEKSPAPATNAGGFQQVEQEREATILRNQLVGLQRQVAQLSQSVTQQQALLNESSRLKFLQLVPSAGAGISAPARSLSPALQRALFLGMVRELGWQPGTNDAFGAQFPANFFEPGMTNHLNVDFVDLRPKTPETPRLQSELQAQPSETKIAASQTPAAATIPAFVTGDSVVLALDSTVAAPGTQLTFTSDDGTVIGSAALGENPLVVRTFSANFLAAGSAGGASFSVTATSPNGFSYTLRLEAVPSP